jgi:hypothetical protein
VKSGFVLLVARTKAQQAGTGLLHNRGMRGHTVFYHVKGRPHEVF